MSKTLWNTMKPGQILAMVYINRKSRGKLQNSGQHVTLPYRLIPILKWKPIFHIIFSAFFCQRGKCCQVMVAMITLAILILYPVAWHQTTACKTSTLRFSLASERACRRYAPHSAKWKKDVESLPARTANTWPINWRKSKSQSTFLGRRKVHVQNTKNNEICAHGL